jgi:hypothetical protein
MQEEQSNVKVVILWDLIKNRIKESEEDEMCRMIGKGLIDSLEDLRFELQSLVDISQELE